jgi:hypothetical protein
VTAYRGIDLASEGVAQPPAYDFDAFPGTIGGVFVG